MFYKNMKTMLAASAVGVLSVAAASASTVSYVAAANECGAGGFGACTYDGSPTIIKFDGSLAVDEINSLFPTIDGSEFHFTVSAYDGSEPKSGSWSYTPGAGDPVITAYVVKAGRGYNLFTDLSPAESVGGSWYTPGGKGLSHITFFDTGIAPVPVPAGGVLLLTGLGALALLRRRKRALA